MIRRATTTLAAFAVLWLWLGASAHGGVASDPQVWIAFTNSTNGRLRSCHCPNNPFGGLDRRAWALRQIRERIAPAKLLLLDAGDLFPAQDEPELWPPLLQAYHQLDYDAVCIGDQELSVGIANWLAVVGAHPEWGIPWLAAGYVPKTVRAQGLAAFPAARVFELNGHKIGVVSVTCPGIYRFTAADNSPLTDVDIQPAAQAIADFRALHRDLDVLIVLSHQGLDTDVELAKNQPGIDVIIGGHSQSLVTEPLVVNNTVICQAGPNGAYLGVVCLRLRTLDAACANPPIPEATAAPVFSVLRTRRWDLSRVLIPLLDNLDEDPQVGATLDTYYRTVDQALAVKLREPRSAATEPCLVIPEPHRNYDLRPGEEKVFSIVLRNTGGAELTIGRVRSKAAWLELLRWPERIPAGGAAPIIFRARPGNNGRYLRGEYTVQNNDKQWPVGHGFVNVTVIGKRTDLFDVAGAIDRLVALTTPPPKPPAADAGVVPPKAWPDTLSVRNGEAGKVEATTARDATTGREPVLVELFYSTGCEDCRVVKEDILPLLREKFPGQVRIVEYDVMAKTENLNLLFAREKQVGSHGWESVSIFVNRNVALDGLAAIHERLEATVRQCLLQKGAAVPMPPLSTPAALVEKATK